jgi:secreted Zn-dependent insulinase-like peptidase
MAKILMFDFIRRAFIGRAFNNSSRAFNNSSRAFNNSSRGRLPRRRAPVQTLAWLLCAFLLAACSPDSPPAGSTEQSARAADAPAADAQIQINKSPNDNRNYRYLVLDNALRVLLVEDPDTDKAAASLTVLRGSYHEPAAYQGLAHFLEHMLFIGTERYPEVDGYQQFIATHGGSSNAYTAAEHTNYFFDIEPGQFQAAMDRFSQFFISPLLDPAYVDREKNAVNSEYQMQIKNDGWRVFSATKATMNPDYPGSRFNIGNLETLGEGVGDALKIFFEENYSADQMVLVALSNEPLDDMEQWVRPMFSAIENRNLGPSINTIKAFAEESVPSTLRVQTLKDENQVSFNFPIPATEVHYRNKPAQYLTNLLGHEGAGSLHQALTSRGWIQSLGAGTNRLDETNAYLSIDIELTDAGLAHIDEIASLMFAAIDQLKSREPEAWRFDEQAAAAGLNFRFQEKSSATGFVYQTAPALGLYPPEDVLAAPYLMEEFDPALIKSYLAYLTRDNLITTITGPDVATNAVEPWFDVPYQLEVGDIAVVDVDASTLHLPDTNPFLPENLALVPEDNVGPAIEVEKPGIELWLDVDTEFNVPRANQYLTLGVEGGLLTPEDQVHARVYQRLVNDSLNEYAYPALLAGLGYQLSVVPAGFRLGVWGYADKQIELLNTVLERFVSLEMTADRFDIYKQELLKNWRNFKNERPYQQGFSALGNLLLSNSWAPDVLAATLEPVTLESLEAWRSKRLKSFSVLGLSHGNLNDNQLNAVAGLLQKNLPIRSFDLAEPSVAVVEEALLLGLDIDHDDASMVLYRQDPEASHDARARSALAAQMLRQQFFTELRTQQQLGYVVSAVNRTLVNRGGLAFVIQSPVASAAALEAATVEFMKAQPAHLEAMTDEEFAQHKAGLISRLTERDKNLRERTTRYLSDLDVGETSFDSQARIAEIVAGLDRADMLEFYRSLLADLTSRRVLVYSDGKFDETPSVGRRITSAAALKAPAAESADAAD